MVASSLDVKQTKGRVVSDRLTRLFEVIVLFQAETIVRNQPDCRQWTTNERLIVREAELCTILRSMTTSRAQRHQNCSEMTEPQ